MLRFSGEGVAKYLSLKPSSKSDWNCLVSLSWRIVRSRSVSSLVPDNEFVRFIESEVVKKFRFNRWIEVVATPRAGKSAGVVRGVIRWVVENDLSNYVVLVVASNRRLAENLYKYVVGACLSI